MYFKIINQVQCTIRNSRKQPSTAQELSASDVSILQIIAYTEFRSSKIFNQIQCTI